MRVNFAYGAMLGILAASFGVLGPVPAQAGAMTATPAITTASHHAVGTDRIAQRSDGCGWNGCGGCWNGWCGGGCGWNGWCGGFDHFRHFDHFRDFDHFGHGGFGHGDFGHGGFGHGGFGHGGFGHGGFRR